MKLGSTDNHASVFIIGHFLQGEGFADHVDVY